MNHDRNIDRRGTAARAGQRRDPPLQPAPDPAGVRARRAAQAQGRRACSSSGPAAWARRWACTSPPRASAGSASSTSTWSTPPTCSGRSSTAPPTSAARSSTRRVTGSRGSTRTWRCRRTRRGSPRPTRSTSRGTTTSSSTGPTTSRRATWSTTPACCWASRTCTAASSASRDRRRCSRPTPGPAIAASSAIRHRRGWCRAAPKAGCSGCCPDSSA